MAITRLIAGEHGYCKNSRVGFKEKCKGVAFTVEALPRPNFVGDYDNQCIYIGYEDIEIGVSTAPYKDGDNGYTWFYNYIGDGANDNARGIVYYPFGSKILVQLYLDGTDMKLVLKINGIEVCRTPRTHGWGDITFNGNLGTRIINSIEQNYQSQSYAKFGCTHEKIRFIGVKIFTSEGWKSVDATCVGWGLGEWHGVEITYPYWATDYEHGNYPTVSPYPITSDEFQVSILS